MFYFDTFIVFNFNFWFNRNNSLKVKTIFADFYNIKIYFVIYNIQASLVNSILQSTRINIINRIFIKNIFTVIFFNKSSWSLTFSKAWNRNFFNILFESLIYSFFKILCSNFNFQFITIRFNFI